ncbi:RNA polymerase sigma factor [Croceitalea marina]|uniref:RNA polymerase sigma factor n=1 Tax=Croceitalea marina TaxID=1775166 RepID=A0ABW5N1D8_9FLAO
MNKEEALQQRLRAGDKKTLEELYLTHKDSFIVFFKSRANASIDIEDLFQDSIIALFQSFVLKKTELKKSTVKTYLFAIGKNKLAQKFNGPVLVDEKEDVIETHYEIDDNGLSTEQKMLIKSFKLLGNKCKELIKMYYYRGLTNKEIVMLTSYKDENTVKSYRSRCLKQLKNSIHGR